MIVTVASYLFERKKSKYRFRLFIRLRNININPKYQFWWKKVIINILEREQRIRWRLLQIKNSVWSCLFVCNYCSCLLTDLSSFLDMLTSNFSAVDSGHPDRDPVLKSRGSLLLGTKTFTFKFRILFELDSLNREIRNREKFPQFEIDIPRLVEKLKQTFVFETLWSEIFKTTVDIVSC